MGGDHCVRVVAHPKGVHAEGVVDRVESAVPVGRRLAQPQRAVVVHAEQLDAVALRRGDQGVGSVADPEGVDAPGPSGLCANGHWHDGLQGAVVLVDADHLDNAAVIERRDNGVCPAIARHEGVDGAGPVEAKAVDVVGRRGVFLQGAILAHAQQLDAGVYWRGHNCERVIAKPEGVDVGCAAEHQAAGVGHRPVSLQGAVLVHADHLDGGVVYRGRHHKRAVAHDERVDAMDVG